MQMYNKCKIRAGLVVSIATACIFVISLNTKAISIRMHHLSFYKYVTSTKATEIIGNKSVSGGNDTFKYKLPKVIYMLWDKGFHRAPPLQKGCLESFRHHNTDFEIRALNLSEAEKLIERGKHYSDQAWHSAAIQAKSDIIRVELLANYGGVWADATVYCMEPLSNWLNESLLSQRFLSYERKDGEVNKDNSPWISSWFLVATNNSAIMQIWRSEVRRAWGKTPSPLVTFGYFWVHRIFRNLVRNDITFGNMFRAMPFLDAGGPHCFIHTNSTPHVYKIKAGSCRKESEQLLGR